MSSGIGQNSDSVSFISWSITRVSLLHNSFTSLLNHWIHVDGVEFSICVRPGNLYGLLNSIIPHCLRSRSSVAKLSSVSLHCIDSSIDYSQPVRKHPPHIFFPSPFPVLHYTPLCMCVHFAFDP